MKTLFLVLNDATADDSCLFSSTRPALAVGNVLRISAGTLTASAGTRVSTFGTSVPEPGSVALLGTGAALAAGCCVIRRRAGRSW